MPGNGRRSGERLICSGNAFRTLNEVRDGLPLPTQIRLVRALAAIHNFMNEHEGYDLDSLMVMKVRGSLNYQSMMKRMITTVNFP